MRRIVQLFFSAALAIASAQTGTVSVSANITATAGALVCTGTATVGPTSSVMHMKCVDGSAVVIPDTDYPVVAPGATTISVSRGTNSVTWILTKGNPVPDQWQVTANGVTKSGTF